MTSISEKQRGSKPSAPAMANSKENEATASPTIAKRSKTLSTILMKKFEQKFESLTAAIDDSLEKDDFMPSLCMSMQPSISTPDITNIDIVKCSPHDITADVNITDDTAANTSDERSQGHNGNNGHPADSPDHNGNFASWLSSQEFDASAIVWNGDDNNPQDLSGELDAISTMGRSCDYSRDEFLSAENQEEDDGYVSISDSGKRDRGDHHRWLPPQMIPPQVSDAWNKVVSTHWQCWQGPEPNFNADQSSDKSKLDGAKIGFEKRQAGTITGAKSRSKNDEKNKPSVSALKSTMNPPSILKKKSPFVLEMEPLESSKPIASGDNDVEAPPKDEAKKPPKDEAAPSSPGNPEDAQSQVSSHISTHVSSYAQGTKGSTPPTDSSVATPLEGELFLDDGTLSLAMTPHRHHDTTMTTPNSYTYSASANSCTYSAASPSHAVLGNGIPCTHSSSPSHASAAPATTFSYDSFPFAAQLPREDDDEDDTDDIPLMNGFSDQDGALNRIGSFSDEKKTKWSKGRQRRRMRLKK